MVTNTYTPRGEVAQIGLDGAALATYTYTPVSRLASKSLENGTTTAYSYDAAHRLLGLNHQAGGAAFAAFHYTLDAVGNRTAKTQSGLLARSETYAYDKVDQLVSANYATQGSTRQVSYQYDATGNRQWRNDAGTTTNYAVNADNAYTQIGGGLAVIDPNGNHAGTPGSTAAATSPPIASATGNSSITTPGRPKSASRYST